MSSRAATSGARPGFFDWSGLRVLTFLANRFPQLRSDVVEFYVEGDREGVAIGAKKPGALGVVVELLADQPFDDEASFFVSENPPLDWDQFRVAVCDFTAAGASRLRPIVHRGGI
jgi:hypothetical protein